LEWSTPFQHKDIQTQFFFAKLKTINLGKKLFVWDIGNKSLKSQMKRPADIIGFTVFPS